MKCTIKKLSGMAVRVVEYAGGTWLQPEEAAYVGGMKRRGAAMFPDGKVRRVYVGLPDSFFSAPAHARVKGNYVKGFVMLDDDGVLRFHSDARRITACVNACEGIPTEALEKGESIEAAFTRGFAAGKVVGREEVLGLVRQFLESKVEEEEF